MRKFVKNHIASCTECAYHKRPGGKPEGVMHIIKREPILFHIVNCDHLGSFPMSTKKNTHLIVYVDGFTKY